MDESTCRSTGQRRLALDISDCRSRVTGPRHQAFRGPQRALLGDYRNCRHIGRLLICSAFMCGRVDIHPPPSQLARLLEVQLAAGVDPDGRPSWNVPPARGIPAITERHTRTENGEKSDDHERVMDVLRWGLVPHWAKDPRTGYKMINARAETVTKKTAYRSAFANHRCLVVVDGFFEWQVPDPD